MNRTLDEHTAFEKAVRAALMEYGITEKILNPDTAQSHSNKTDKLDEALEEAEDNATNDSENSWKERAFNIIKQGTNLALNATIEAGKTTSKKVFTTTDSLLGAHCATEKAIVNNLVAAYKKSIQEERPDDFSLLKACCQAVGNITYAIRKTNSLSQKLEEILKQVYEKEMRLKVLLIDTDKKTELFFSALEMTIKKIFHLICRDQSIKNTLGNITYITNNFLGYFKINVPYVNDAEELLRRISLNESDKNLREFFGKKFSGDIQFQDFLTSTLDPKSIKKEYLAEIQKLHSPNELYRRGRNCAVKLLVFLREYQKQNPSDFFDEQFQKAFQQTFALEEPAKNDKNTGHKKAIPPKKIAGNRYLLWSGVAAAVVGAGCIYTFKNRH